MVSRDSVKFDVVFDKGVSGLFVDHRWVIVCSVYLFLVGWRVFFMMLAL